MIRAYLVNNGKDITLDTTEYTIDGVSYIGPVPFKQRWEKDTKKPFLVFNAFPDKYTLLKLKEQFNVPRFKVLAVDFSVAEARRYLCHLQESICYSTMRIHEWEDGVSLRELEAMLKKEVLQTLRPLTWPNHKQEILIQGVFWHCDCSFANFHRLFTTKCNRCGSEYKRNVNDYCSLEAVIATLRQWPLLIQKGGQK